MGEIISGYKIFSPMLDGEPTFTLRAKDNYAVPILKLIQHVYGVNQNVIDWFEKWRTENPEKCKDPD